MFAWNILVFFAEWEFGFSLAVDFFSVLVWCVHEHLHSEEQACDAVLPALGVLCQWFMGNSSSIWQEESVKLAT